MSSDTNENPWDRRHILCGGGALVFSAMMASLLIGRQVRYNQVAVLSGRDNSAHGHQTRI